MTAKEVHAASDGTHAEERRARPGSVAGVVLALAAATLVLAAYVLGRTEPAVLLGANRLIAVIALIHGMTFFVLHGGRRITVAGLFMAFSATVVGIAGLMVIADPYLPSIPNPQWYVSIALCASALTQIGIGTYVWILGYHEVPRLISLRRSMVVSFQSIGVGVMAAAFLLGEQLGNFREGFGFSGAILVSLASALDQHGSRRIRNIILMVAPLGVYALVFHDGTGRLRVVAIFCAMAFAVSLREGRRWHKLLIVMALPLALTVLGAWRNYIELETLGAVDSESGISSMLASIRIFALVVYASENGMPLAWGTSFLSPIRAALPDSLVPSWIPEALGYQLVAILSPDRVGSGFSTVSSVYGEWWWNFSVAGLVIAVPVLAILLAKLDDLAAGIYVRTPESPLRLIAFAFLVSLIGGIGDLVWSGVHTWVVRMYARGLLFAVVAALVALFHLRQASTRAGRRRRPLRHGQRQEIARSPKNNRYGQLECRGGSRQ